MARAGLIGALLAVTGVLLVAAPAHAAPDDPIDIPDPALRACVSAALAQPVEDPITEAEAASLTSLACNGAGVIDLAGMQFLTGAQTITLRGNEISDLSPLQNLTAVASLDLFDNAISDIAPLQGLTALTWLNLYVNQVTDLTPFASMTQLTYLTIGENGITDIGPLAALTNLQTLSLLRNQIADISALQGLTTLRELALDDNVISDLTPLAGLGNVVNLWLGRNQIADLSPLEGLASLAVLGFEGNHIVDLSPLGSLPSLRSGFGTGQTATLPDVACGTVQPNPVVDRSGAPVALTGDGYDAATDSFPNTVAGTHQYTWDVQLADVANRFSGTLTQTVLSCVSAPVEPSEPAPVEPSEPPPAPSESAGAPSGPRLAESGMDASTLPIATGAAALLAVAGAGLVALTRVRRGAR